MTSDTSITRSAANRRGPLVPLIAWSGDQDCLAASYVREAGPAPVAGDTRPEIAGLMDMGLYGAGLAALTTFETSDLPPPRLALYQRFAGSRTAIRLGVSAPSDLQVTEDQSADLGLLLALAGHAAEVDLGHVVATGTLRSGGIASGNMRAARVGVVGGVGRKVRLLRRFIETTGEPRVIFIYPAETPAAAGDEEDWQTLLEDSRTLAASRGIALQALPVADVGAALDHLSLTHRPYRLADRAMLAGLVATFAVIAGWLALDAWLSRPVAMTWAPPPAKTGTSASTPLWVERLANGRKRYCLLVRGQDQIPVAPAGAVLHFRARVDAPRVMDFAIIEALETRGVRVRPLPNLAQQVAAADAELASGLGHYHMDFGPALESKAEYARIMLVARRWPAVDLSALEARLHGIYDAASPGGGAEAVANLLKAEFPGYLQFGFRSVEEDVTCTPAPRT